MFFFLSYRKTFLGTQKPVQIWVITFLMYWYVFQNGCSTWKLPQFGGEGWNRREGIPVCGPYISHNREMWECSLHQRLLYLYYSTHWLRPQCRQYYFNSVSVFSLLFHVNPSNRSGIRGGRGVQSNPPLTQNSIFTGNCRKFDKFRIS